MQVPPCNLSCAGCMQARLSCSYSQQWPSRRTGWTRIRRHYLRCCGSAGWWISLTKYIRSPPRRPHWLRCKLDICTHVRNGVAQGRLPVTFPNVENEQNMTMEQYPGVPTPEWDLQCNYSEGLINGYRWYDSQAPERKRCMHVQSAPCLCIDVVSWPGSARGVGQV